MVSAQGIVEREMGEGGGERGIVGCENGFVVVAR